MENLNILCGYCTNHLYDHGVVINTEIGPLLMCGNCRGLYYIEIGINPSTDKTALYIKIANFPKEEEFNLIRGSTEHLPLAQFIKATQEPPRKQVINEPIQKEDLKELINSSVTPLDFLKKLKQYE